VAEISRLFDKLGFGYGCLTTPIGAVLWGLAWGGVDFFPRSQGVGAIFIVPWILFVIWSPNSRRPDSQPLLSATPARLRVARWSLWFFGVACAAQLFASIFLAASGNDEVAETLMLAALATIYLYGGVISLAAYGLHVDWLQSLRAVSGGQEPRSR
jgi:hypothetical protein